MMENKIKGGSVSSVSARLKRRLPTNKLISANQKAHDP